MKKSIKLLVTIFLVISLSCFSVNGLDTQNIQSNIVKQTQDANAVYSLNSYTTGYIDTITQTEITGWAYDSRYPNTAISVQINIYEIRTGTLVKVVTITAGNYRQDLEAAGYGNGYHAFTYYVNWDEFPINSSYRIYVYAIDNSTNPLLQYSGSEYTPVRYEWVFENGFWYLKKGTQFAVGWRFIDGFWYYMTPTSRIDYSGSYYYPANAMMTNWLDGGGGTWYYLYVQTITIGGVTYPQGAMARGVVTLGGVEHYFADNGCWQNWRMPLDILSPSVSQEWGGIHNGIDFDEPEGTPIYNSVAGKVEHITTGGSMGNAVCIETDVVDPNGSKLIVRYLHMKYAPLVSVGDTVSEGQLLGYIGNTGTSSRGVHLHFDVIKSGSWNSPAISDTYNPRIFFENF